MKIVFVQPNVGFKGHTWEALGIGYLIAYLKNNYAGILEIDFYSGFYDSDERIIQGAKDADIIGFGCTSPQYKHGFNLARQIKTRNNRVIFGGIHPTVLPEQVLAEDCVDAVVLGEGEQSMLQLVKEVAQGIDISGRSYQTGYIANVDDLPFPDRETIKNERNIEQAHYDEGTRITSVVSSRGCPFHCSFCCSHVLWGHGVRLRTPSNILDEIEELVSDWRIEFLKFADDTFTVSKPRVMKFCRLKVARGISVPYGANAHVNTIDREMLVALAQSGCQELWYGVESGSPRILKEMHKNTNIQHIKEVFRATKEVGIKTRAYFLLGTPNETREDIAMTERLCGELGSDIVGFTLLSPFPGNQYYDAQSMADWDWSVFDEYGNDWVHTIELTNQGLKEIQSKLVAKYEKATAFRHRSKK